jgi:hypothetical protein
MHAARYEPARSLLGFWVSEGFAPGLVLAGFVAAPSEMRTPPDPAFPKGFEAGDSLDWISPADIAETS